MGEAFHEAVEVGGAGGEEEFGLEFGFFKCFTELGVAVAGLEVQARGSISIRGPGGEVGVGEAGECKEPFGQCFYAVLPHCGIFARLEDGVISQGGIGDEGVVDVTFGTAEVSWFVFFCFTGRFLINGKSGGGPCQAPSAVQGKSEKMCFISRFQCLLFKNEVGDDVATQE